MGMADGFEPVLRSVDWRDPPGRFPTAEDDRRRRIDVMIRGLRERDVVSLEQVGNIREVRVDGFSMREIV